MFSEDVDDSDDGYEQSLPERNPGDISEAEKYQFLHSIRGGLNPSEAAHALGYKGRHFRSIRSPKSMFYDEDFTREYGQAISSVEYEHNRLERLRAAAQSRALSGSDRLLEKLLMVYDPDWAVLREKSTEVNVNVRHFIETHFRSLPTEKLEEILALMDENTVDAEVLEIEQSAEAA